MRHEWGETEKTNRGVRKADASTDVIKRGSTFQRIANDESVDSRRKYVSLTRSDNDTYKSMFEMLGLDANKEKYMYELTAKKDLKVANGEKVTQHIIDTYGDKSIKEAYSEYTRLGGRHMDDFKLSRDKKQAWMKNYKDGLSTKVSSFLNKTLFDSNLKTTKIGEIGDHFKKQGYDAIVDAEDFVGGLADYPLILLDPSKSVKISKKTNLAGS